MRHFFAINPQSFTSQEVMGRFLTELNNFFSTNRSLVRNVHISRYPRDTVAVVHDYIQQVPPDETVRVYAVGGDGILFDCLNGMVEFPNAEITNIPYGKSNDFMRAFGMDAKQRFMDLSALINGPAHWTDVIDCGSNYAISQVSIGLEAQAVINTNALLRKFRSKWLYSNMGKVYVIAAVQASINKEVINQQYQIAIDDEDFSGSYFNLRISNSPCSGASMITEPHAKPDDGLLEMILCKSSPWLTMMKSMPDYINGRTDMSPIFIKKKVTDAEISSDAPMRVYLDGEGFYAEKLTVKVLPKRVKFFAPEGMVFADYTKIGNKRTRKERKNESKE
jgi:diacylglycerol kinase family enzyme